ncbi:MAG: hypothetical protein P4M15_03050 [Alphaproteobacteria bacterium]|nr:hypothetical protein [Alphaproteobacteria bacterium]
MATQLPHEPARVILFALGDRWIVTVESVRRLVKVRHRTRWYAVARRKGHEGRSHWCSSRADALWIAERMREAFEAEAFYASMTKAHWATIRALEAMQRARRARNPVQKPMLWLGDQPANEA